MKNKVDLISKGTEYFHKGTEFLKKQLHTGVLISTLFSVDANASNKIEIHDNVNNIHEKVGEIVQDFHKTNNIEDKKLKEKALKMSINKFIMDSVDKAIDEMIQKGKLSKNLDSVFSVLSKNLIKKAITQLTKNWEKISVESVKEYIIDNW